MTAFIAALIVNLQVSVAPATKCSLNQIEMHRMNSASRESKHVGLRADDLAMRDWKLLMPNWKPKTAALAYAEPENSEITPNIKGQVRS